MDDGFDSYSRACCHMPASATGNADNVKGVVCGFNGLYYPMPIYNPHWLRVQDDHVLKRKRVNHSAMFFQQAAIPDVSNGVTTRGQNCFQNSTKATSTETGLASI